MDRCHLIPKQRIKRALSTVMGRDTVMTKAAIDKVVWHGSTWVWGCRRHHADYDNYVFRVPRSAVPAQTWAFADAFGLRWSLERDFPDV